MQVKEERPAALLVVAIHPRHHKPGLLSRCIADGPPPLPVPLACSSEPSGLPEKARGQNLNCLEGELPMATPSPLPPAPPPSGHCLIDALLLATHPNPRPPGPPHL